MAVRKGTEVGGAWKQAAERPKFVQAKYPMVKWMFP
jgi:hypothetical protein